jgi:hypothetical protein
MRFEAEETNTNILNMARVIAAEIVAESAVFTRSITSADQTPFTTIFDPPKIPATPTNQTPNRPSDTRG